MHITITDTWARVHIDNWGSWGKGCDGPVAAQEQAREWEELGEAGVKAAWQAKLQHGPDPDEWERAEDYIDWEDEPAPIYGYED